MYSSSLSSSNIIYVGNIQSIKDEQLREYFQRFGNIESLFNNCTRAADEWLIDYRFIKFSSDTDMSIILTNKFDHDICRIRLDIHPYEAAFKDETRLVSDRKICITHTNPKLDRNVIKKAFTKYGRILNCTCVSSGNGVEHVYIEFESINSVHSIFKSHQQIFAGKTPLAVKQPLRPSQVVEKTECISVKEQDVQSPLITDYSRPKRLNYNVDTAQYSSVLINHHHNNNITQQELRRLTPIRNQLLNSLSKSQNRLSISSDTQQLNSNILYETNIESSLSCSQQQLKDYEHEYDLIIRQDFDEATYQIDKFLQNQKQSYKKLRQFIHDEIHSVASSSSSEDGEIRSSSLSDVENFKNYDKKRLKSHY